LLRLATSNSAAKADRNLSARLRRIMQLARLRRIMQLARRTDEFFSQYLPPLK
jgi:hypothetical protein